MTVPPRVTGAEREALRRAQELALRGTGEVEPNPTVGAVVLRGGEVVGEGWHARYGGPHAEVAALADAGDRARGATVCVTLEPCCTTGKTGPCTEALLAAGVTRVVVGCVDPAPGHAGRGLADLRAAGVDVEVVGSPTCEAVLRRFTDALARRRPHVFAKWAMSADGAIAPADRTRTVLSGPEAHALVHRWRGAVDAVLVGVGTVVADDPRLTARGDEAPTRPLRRVVLDPRLRTPPGSVLATTTDKAPTWIVADEEADPRAADALEEHGARVLRVPEGPEWTADALEVLGLEGVRRLLVEGGSDTLGRLVAADLVDQVACFLTPARLGDDALPAVAGLELGGLDAQAIAQILRLQGVRVEPVGPDVLVRGFRPVREDVARDG